MHQPDASVSLLSYAAYNMHTISSSCSLDIFFLIGCSLIGYSTFISNWRIIYANSLAIQGTFHFMGNNEYCNKALRKLWCWCRLASEFSIAVCTPMRVTLTLAMRISNPGKEEASGILETAVHGRTIAIQSSTAVQAIGMTG
ncbi:hypothetical protein T06_10878 [Trichinella sp. T6]|nr:hypothetical protein T06_10878 [Trichinella sp. T6]